MSDIAVREDEIPPQLVEGSVIFFSYASIALAAIMSITINVYHDTRPATTMMGLPKPIAFMVGVFVPLLVAFISHVAATIPTSRWVKGWLFGLTAALMYVSATAGVKTLMGTMGLGPALAVSIGVDATAMTFLGILMLAGDRKTDLAAWKEQAAERERCAAVAAVAARQARPAARETGGENTLTAARGNTPAAARGNALALEAGQAASVPAPAGTLAGGGEIPSGDGPEGEGSGLASVSPMRRPAVTDEEIRMLAEDLADELALEGKSLTVRAYTDRYGGKTVRVSPVVAQVKSARDLAALAAAGAR